MRPARLIVKDANANMAQLIVCERTGVWTAALRRAIGSSYRIVRECRNLADAEQMLDCWCASLVAVEVTPAGFDRALGWLRDLERRWPLARAVALVSRELDDDACWALREAGAIDVARSPRDLGGVADVAVRHVARAPARMATVSEQVLGSVPWLTDFV